MRGEIEPQSDAHRRYLEAQAQRVQVHAERLAEWYPAPRGICLEIGCGHGHYLTAFGQQHPSSQCLGIDLVSRRIEKARQKAAKRVLPNVRFLKAEVTEFLRAWPQRLTLERVFILFPDPWPKKRHAKNRILQPELLDALTQISVSQTKLHFRTDHEENFAWCMDVVAGNPAWILCDDEDWPFESPSYFQELMEGYQSFTARYAPEPVEPATTASNSRDVGAP